LYSVRRLLIRCGVIGPDFTKSGVGTYEYIHSVLNNPANKPLPKDVGPPCPGQKSIMNFEEVGVDELLAEMKVSQKAKGKKG